MASGFLILILQIILLYFQKSCSGLPTELKHNIIVLNWCSNRRISYKQDYGFNLKFIKLKKDSLTFYNTIIALQNFIEKRGVSLFIICQNPRTSFNVIDIFAGHLRIPVVKRFYDGRPSLLAKEKNTILHLEPHHFSQLPVISQLLQFYKWKSVAILSDNDDVNLKKTSELMTMLKNTENLQLQLLVNFTIKFDQDHLELLNIMNSIQVSAVVILSEHDLAVLFLRKAKLHGFTNVVSKSIIGTKREIQPTKRNLRAVLPSAVLEVTLSNYGDTPPTFKHFLEDSLELFRKALDSTSLSENNFHRLSNNGCHGRLRSNFSKNMYRAMKNATIVGRMGRLQFDKNGFRANLEYNVIYRRAGHSLAETNSTVIGRYSKGSLTMFYKSWPPMNPINEKRIVKVVVNELKPYLMFDQKTPVTQENQCVKSLKCRGRDGKDYCCFGYCIDILKMLIQNIGLSVDIHLVKDGQYGELNHTTGQWSGMIGEILRGEADMAIADLIINPRRLTVVDFTSRILDVGMGLLVKVDYRNQSNLTGFLYPFTARLWVGLLILVHAVLLSMWLMEKYSPYGLRKRRQHMQVRHIFSLPESALYTWSLVVPASGVDMRPKSIATRCLSVLFSFCMLITLTSYTANLTAFLVMKEEILPLSKAGIKDPKLQNLATPFAIGTVKGFANEEYFRSSDDPFYQQIWQHMRHYSANSFDEAVKHLESGKLKVFVGDYPTLLYVASHRKYCDLKVIGKPFFEYGFGIALAKNSSLTSLISKALADNKESDDTLTDLRLTWFSGHCLMKDAAEPEAEFRRISKESFSLLFIVICVAITLALIIVLVDRYFCRFFRKKDYNMTPNIRSDQ